MRFEDERYVRIYTRDTITWLALTWQARALLMFILRKADRAGVIELGRGGERGLAALVGMPLEVVNKALPELVSDGCVEQVGTNIVIPKFIEAQEATKSPAQRQHESRVNRRDLMRAGLDPDQRQAVIYFIQSEHGGPVKIGRADDLAKRLVGLQTSRPDKLVVLAAAPGTIAQEKELHRHFAEIREKGEWFTASPNLMALVRDVAARGVAALSAVTNRDASRGVTPYETQPVTPSLAVPSDPAVPAEQPRARGTTLGPGAVLGREPTCAVREVQGADPGDPRAVEGGVVPSALESLGAAPAVEFIRPPEEHERPMPATAPLSSQFWPRVEQFRQLVSQGLAVIGPNGGGLKGLESAAQRDAMERQLAVVGVERAAAACIERSRQAGKGGGIKSLSYFAGPVSDLAEPGAPVGGAPVRVTAAAAPPASFAKGGPVAI